MLYLYRDVLKSFHLHKVKYVVIGGVAVGAHGIGRQTLDLDILIEPTEANAQRLLAAMLEVGLVTASLTTAAAVAKRSISIFRDYLPLDVHTSPPGLSFTTAWKNRSTTRRYGFPIYFVGINDLLRSKRASGRPQDLDDVRILTNHRKQRHQKRRRKST